MKINNVEFEELDFTEATFVEKYNNAYKKMLKEAEKIDLTNIEPAEGIRQECKMIKNFLDNVLGEEASKKIFGEKDSLKECIKTLEDLKQYKEDQERYWSERVLQFSPERLKK